MKMMLKTLLAPFIKIKAFGGGKDSWCMHPPSRAIHATSDIESSRATYDAPGLRYCYSSNVLAKPKYPFVQGLTYSDC
jgi:hypothetical protein